VNRYWTLLLVLAAAWGASYLFIKVAVEGGLEPAPLMCARASIAAVVLFGFLATTMGAGRAVSELRVSWRRWAVLGLVANAVPFWLVAWGEKHVDSGIAAIAQSTVPLFTILLGLRFLPHEPLSRAQLSGFGLGLVGVAVGTLVPVVSAAAFVLFPAACRRVGVPVVKALAESMWPAAWPAAVMVGVLLAGRALAPSSLAAIAGQLVVAGLIYEALFFGIAIPGDERRFYWSKAMQIATRRRRVPIAA
jgi:drug/metabolite transporter (DMT)-like permease